MVLTPSKLRKKKKELEDKLKKTLNDTKRSEYRREIRKVEKKLLLRELKFRR